MHAAQTDVGLLKVGRTHVAQQYQIPEIFSCCAALLENAKLQPDCTRGERERERNREGERERENAG
jgi:hypothetical protein